MIALVDCNNFYASCERVFQPHLWNRPVIVLSNNDGCVVSRSNEAKTLGIGMGVPVFQVNEIVRKNKVAVLSSNYALYADMSSRVMKILSKYSPDIELYSIDEAFLSLKGIEHHADHAAQLRADVKRSTGIPVSVGIAETKVLSKIAGKFAKKSAVFIIPSGDERERLLAETDIQDVWGIARRFATRLRRMNINTAKEFRDAGDSLVRSVLGVVGWRIQRELRGEPCTVLELSPPPRKAVATSRSFAYPTDNMQELEEALASYTARAAEKLRQQNLCASAMTVFCITDQFKFEPQFFGSRTWGIAIPTNETGELIHQALDMFHHIYRGKYRLRKSGVMLTGLVSASCGQGDLFDRHDRVKGASLMRMMDAVNKECGSGTLRFAAEGVAQPWKTISQQRFPRYTTRWNELVKAKIE